MFQCVLSPSPLSPTPTPASVSVPAPASASASVPTPVPTPTPAPASYSYSYSYSCFRLLKLHEVKARSASFEVAHFFSTGSVSEGFPVFQTHPSLMRRVMIGRLSPNDLLAVSLLYSGFQPEMCNFKTCTAGLYYRRRRLIGSQQQSWWFTEMN